MESSVDPDPLPVTAASTANRTSAPFTPRVTCPPSSVDRPVRTTITSLAPAIVSRPAPPCVTRQATGFGHSAPASISASSPAPVSHPTPTATSTGSAPITISRQAPAASSPLPVTTSGAFQPTVASVSFVESMVC